MSYDGLGCEKCGGCFCRCPPETEEGLSLSGDTTESLSVGVVKVNSIADAPFQDRVLSWLLACFGAEISSDKQERNHRFLEESLELVQSCSCTADEAHQLVDYVYGRKTGQPSQEVGGVMVTLAALCLANGFDMHGAGETELARIWTKVETIRAKQAAKPKHSPLPEHVAPVALLPDDWQPIESAPVNESVLVYIPNAEHYGEGIYRAIWIESDYEPHPRHWQTTGLHHGRDLNWLNYQPTHWMPLPALPLPYKPDCASASALDRDDTQKE